jgi:MATE family multidrug resistance protein
MSVTKSALPAARVAADGRLHVDIRALLRLAAPLMVTNAIQALLNLTDTWFLGRLSTDALAAMGAIYWLMTCAILLLSGVGIVTQSFVAQADGARRYVRASQSMWNGLWAAVLALPVFVLIAFAGAALFGQLRLSGNVESLAVSYWEPRMFGAVLGTLTYALTGFFTGIGRMRYTTLIAGVTVAANLPANEWFMFELELGMAGAAWGTNLAQAIGLLTGVALLAGTELRRRYRPWLTWRPHWRRIRKQFAVGMPVGVMYGADVLGVALMQLMVTQWSIVGAAATQIVLMLTSIAFMPALGLATAGATVVGQAIGAGDKQWAARIGTFVIHSCAVYMLSIALLLLWAGPWIVPAFLKAGDAAAADVLAIALLLLWPAAAYQFFDGLYFGSSFGLRAAGDTRVPAITAIALSWVIFLPLAHTLVFDAEYAWLPGLPQFGLGALGGWLALMIYATCLGTLMYRRWRSLRWQTLDLWR